MIQWHYVPKQYISLTSLGILALGAIALPSPSWAQNPTDNPPPELNQLSAPPTQEAPYTLGAGDVIQVFIFSVEQYSSQQEVLVDGTVNLPQAGSISLSGMTLEQAARAIGDRYESARILRNPRVTISLITPRPLRIGISGEINRPGSYTMIREGSQFPTITRALQLAGGITQAADLRQVQLRRPQRGTSDQIINLNLMELLQTGSLSNDIGLRDEDVIYIPTATEIDPEMGRQIARASFANNEATLIDIAVSGEVRRPGPYTIPSQGGLGGVATITQAIKQAGGIRLMADISRVQIRRLTSQGQEQILEVNLEPILDGDNLQQDIVLQNGDSIFIPGVETANLEQLSSRRTASFAADQSEPLNIAVIGQVFRPGPYTVTGTARTGDAGVPGAAGGGSIPTVTRAIQVAGGVKPEADIRQVEIRRSDSRGSRQVITINLWELLQNGDATQDTILQEGDTVFVPTATEINPVEMGAIANASFSPNNIRVNVVGEVQRSGVVQIPPNTPLNEAILTAGGFTSRAHQSSVELIRFRPDGTVEQRRLQIDFTQGGNSPNNPPLQNNDVVIVGRSTLASISDTVDTIIAPLNRVRSLFVVPSAFIDIFRNY
ncbi:MAG: SLBB domain-containing protein [Arthrospira sp. SH-MAG29]|nr:SLBB domain-containing protein [Arthrospira sp. SH-MAG29]MBS0014891.1 SLBB domain-containing protein [Arthrospira sp. SH-MAG29]